MHSKGGQMAETQSTRRNRDRSQNIELDSISKKHLKFFMEQELNYYNLLINNATIRLRAFPEEFVGMKDGWERLWASLAYHGRSIRELAKIDISKWPRDLRVSVPNVAIKGGKLNLEDRKMMLFDIVGIRGNIHPMMRRNLAVEVLRNMIAQAENLVSSQKSATGQMRVPVHILQPMSYPERRHIQLSKDTVEMHYDHETRQTIIKVPYTDKPLIAKDVNLTDEKYDIMVIRQQPNVETNESTPWQVTLLHSSHRYLLDMTDQNVYVKKKRAA